LQEKEGRTVDPNETLRRMLALSSSILAGDDANRASVYTSAAELAELVSDLDTWMSNGGFKPTAWAGKSCEHCMPRKAK
jgi:hypothetical protein